jgi:hypothetical protein
VLGEVGHDLSDQRDELEAVAGEPRGDGDLRVRGVEPDEEVLVRRGRVHARPRVDGSA